MRRLIIPYNILIIIFCLGTTLLFLSSSHHIDIEFHIVNTASLIVFPLTAYFLEVSYNSGKRINLAVSLLIMTLCILLYYIRDLIINNDGDTSEIIIYPVIVALISIIFIVKLLKEKRKQKSIE
jgi:hypothetical protein